MLSSVYTILYSNTLMPAVRQSLRLKGTKEVTVWIMQNPYRILLPR